MARSFANIGNVSKQHWSDFPQWCSESCFVNKPKVLCIKENERLLELVIEVRSRKFYKTIIKISLPFSIYINRFGVTVSRTTHPKLNRWTPFSAKIWTRWLDESATTMELSGPTAMPRGQVNNPGWDPRDPKVSSRVCFCIRLALFWLKRWLFLWLFELVLPPPLLLSLLLFYSRYAQ